MSKLKIHEIIPSHSHCEDCGKVIESIRIHCDKCFNDKKLLKYICIECKNVETDNEEKICSSCKGDKIFNGDSNE